MNIVPIAPCFKGISNSVKTTLQGYIYFVEIFIKEIPLYTYHKIKKKLSQGDSAIATIATLSEQNTSSITKAKKMAQEYYAYLKTFIHEMNNYILKEMLSFFCYPKEYQVELTCNLITTIFLAAYGPSTFLKGTSFMKTLPMMKKLGIKFLMDSSSTVGNVYHIGNNLTNDRYSR